MNTARYPAQRARPRAEQGLFRAEAVRARAQGRPLGAVVRVAPRWVGPALAAVLVVLSAAAALLVGARISRFRSGRVIVRIEDSTAVMAPVGGSISMVAVSPGTRVTRGQTLAHVDDLSLRAELRRVRAELDAALRRTLFDPNDDVAADRLAGLRAQLQELELRGDGHRIVAPCDGTVVDISLATGRRIEAGEHALSIVPDQRRMQVIGVFAGRDLPALQSGQAGFVEFDGFRGVNENIAIETVSPEIMGPTGVERLLGERLAGVLDVDGSVAIVTASLPHSAFEVGDARYELHDGLAGTISIATERERLMFAVFPGLREANLPW